MLHPSVHSMSEGVSMNKMWDQGLRDLQVMPALLLVYFRCVDILWTCSLYLGTLYSSQSAPLASTLVTGQRL